MENEEKFLLKMLAVKQMKDSIKDLNASLKRAKELGLQVEGPFLDLEIACLDPDVVVTLKISDGSSEAGDKLKDR